MRRRIDLFAEPNTFARRHAAWKYWRRDPDSLYDDLADACANAGWGEVGWRAVAGSIIEVLEESRRMPTAEPLPWPQALAVRSVVGAAAGVALEPRPDVALASVPMVFGAEAIDAEWFGTARQTFLEERAKRFADGAFGQGVRQATVTVALVIEGKRPPGWIGRLRLEIYPSRDGVDRCAGHPRFLLSSKGTMSFVGSMRCAWEAARSSQGEGARPCSGRWHLLPLEGGERLPPGQTLDGPSLGGAALRGWMGFQDAPERAHAGHGVLVIARLCHEGGWKLRPVDADGIEKKILALVPLVLKGRCEVNRVAVCPGENLDVATAAINDTLSRFSAYGPFAKLRLIDVVPVAPDVAWSRGGSERGGSGAGATSENVAPRGLSEIVSQRTEALLAYLGALEASLVGFRLVELLRPGIRGDPLHGSLRVMLDCRPFQAREMEERSRGAESGRPVSSRSDERPTYGNPRAVPTMSIERVAALYEEVVFIADPGGGKTEWLRYETLKVVREYLEAIRGGRVDPGTIVPPVFLHLPMLGESMVLGPDDLQGFYSSHGLHLVAGKRFEELCREEVICLRVLRAVQYGMQWPDHVPDQCRHLAIGLIWKAWVGGGARPADDALPRPVMAMDAWDEVVARLYERDTGKERAIEAEAGETIRAFLTVLRQRGYRVRLSSRAGGVDLNLWGGLPTFEILPLTVSRARRLIRLILVDKPRAATALMSEFESKPGIAGLAENPLMLTLIAAAFAPRPGRFVLSLPARRWEILGHVLISLLRPPDCRRSICLREQDVRGELERIAWQFWPRQAIPCGEMRDFVGALIGSRDQKRIREELDTLTRDVPLLVRCGDSYRFLHLCLQEFLAACHLAGRIRERGFARARVHFSEPGLPGSEVEIPLSELLARKAWVPAWHQLILLVAGQMEDPLPLLELLSGADPQSNLDDDRLRQRLSLAIAACGEIRDDYWSARPAARAWLEKIASWFSQQWWTRHRIEMREPAAEEEHSCWWGRLYHCRLGWMTSVLRQMPGEFWGHAAKWKLKERLAHYGNVELRHECWAALVLMEQAPPTLWEDVGIEPILKILSQDGLHPDLYHAGLRALSGAPPDSWAKIEPERVFRYLVAPPSKQGGDLTWKGDIRAAACAALAGAPDSFWARRHSDAILSPEIPPGDLGRRRILAAARCAPDLFWRSLEDNDDLRPRLMGERVDVVRVGLEALACAPSRFWGPIKDPSLILKWLDGENPGMLAAALDALGNAPESFWAWIPPEMLPARLESGERRERMIALRILTKAAKTLFSGIPVEAFCRQLDRGDPELREVALAALARAPRSPSSRSMWEGVTPEMIIGPEIEAEALPALARAPETFWNGDGTRHDGVSIDDLLARLHPDRRDVPAAERERIEEQQRLAMETLRRAPRSFWERIPPRSLYPDDLVVDEVKGDSYRRQAALEGIGQAPERFCPHADPAAVVGRLSDPAWLVRDTALWALSRVPATFWDGIDPSRIYELLESPERAVREIGVLALERAPREFWQGKIPEIFLRSGQWEQQGILERLIEAAAGRGLRLMLDGAAPGRMIEIESLAATG